MKRLGSLAKTSVLVILNNCACQIWIVGNKCWSRPGYIVGPKARIEHYCSNICGLEVFSLLETRTPLSRDFVLYRMYFRAWFGATNAAYSTSSPTPIAPKTAYWLPLTVIIEWDIVPPCRFTFPLQARSPQITPSVIDRFNLNLVCTLIRSFKEKRAGGCEAG